MSIKEALFNMKVFALHCLPHRLAHAIVYKKMHGTSWNYRKPYTYDEKIHWHIVNTYDKTYGRYADKYAVRKYVEECGYQDILVRLYKVFDSADEINLEELPEKFFLITNHASGTFFYERCQNKHLLDVEGVKKKFNKAVKIDFSKRMSCEYHYANINPKILCEELLEEEFCSKISDYKVLCTYGKPIAILVCSERDQGRDYYSCDWKYLEYVKEEYRSKTKIEKPECLDELLKAASDLSRPFPIARIDFYIVNKKMYFSEITLTPSSGNHDYLNALGQKQLGESVPPFFD